MRSITHYPCLGQVTQAVDPMNEYSVVLQVVLAFNAFVAHADPSGQTVHEAL